MSNSSQRQRRPLVAQACSAGLQACPGSPKGLRDIARRAALKGCATLAIVVALTAAGIAFTQESGKTVADGVYTDAQATRGAAAYESDCSGCHRADLGGGTGPALKDERFAHMFAGKDLKMLFTKIATTMPRNAPASLGDNVYLDIVAHVLKENGFPAGSHELAADALDAIRVLPGRPKPPPPVGDFSYVEVVGCLTAAAQHSWMLTNATEPVVTVPSAPTASTTATTKPLGTQTYHLIDALAYAPADHKGQKIYVRGLLIKLPDEQRLTISALEMVAPTCRD